MLIREFKNCKIGSSCYLFYLVMKGNRQKGDEKYENCSSGQY